MTESERTDEVASLEEARARLETALSADPAWQALHAEADASARRHHEQELASNPLYRSWALVSEAIDNLRSIDGETRNPDWGGVAQDQSFETGDSRDNEATAEQNVEGRDNDQLDGETSDSSETIAAEHSAQLVRAGASSFANAGDTQNPPDDLTRINGIDADIAADLAALGIARYAEIAAWRRDDVLGVAEALGLTREISRQNWIEQAALLERRKLEDRRDVEPAQGDIAPESGLSASPHGVNGQEQLAQARDIDLPDIIEAIRKDASASHGGDPASMELDDAPEAWDEPETAHAETGIEDAAVDPSPPNEDGQIVPPVAAADEMHGLADAEVPAASPERDPAATPGPPTQPKSRIPTVAASSHVNTDAAERARRLEEERLRLKRRAEQMVAQTAGETPEASVMFVIREPAHLPQADAAQSASNPVTAPQASLTEDQAAVAAYIAPSKLPEEAEVEVVGAGGSRAHRPGDRPAETGSVRRFLRSLRGG